jgi:RND superfamily putative drug exporter
MDEGDRQRTTGARRRRPRLVLGTWALVVGALALLGAGIEGRLSEASLTTAGTPSAAERSMMQERFGDSVPIAILLQGPRDQVDRQGRRLVAALRRSGGARVLSPFDAEGAGRSLRPKPGAALVVADFRAPLSQAMTRVVPSAERIADRIVAPPVRAHLSGLSVIGRALRDASLQATRRAELIALPVLIVVLLLVFRSPIAAAIPLGMGAATVLAGRGLLRLATYVTSINALSVAIASMMGLALGVDYALLMVSRYRQERERGASHEAAVEIARGAAGRTIMFAGGTLVLAMATAARLAPGALLGPVAVGVVVSGTFSVLLAISALPALLSLAGPAIERWRLPSARRHGRLLGLSERLVAQPAVAIPLVLLAVFALARPALALQLGPPDVRQLPREDPARRSFEAVERAVGPGWAAPFVIVATAHDNVISKPWRLRALSAWQDRIARAPDVAAVIGPGSFDGAQAKAQREYRAAPGRIGDAEHAIAQLRDGLRRADEGVAELRAGLRDGAAGAARIGRGARGAQAGAAQLEAGLGRATAGSGRLARGLDDAAAGADRLLAGQRKLSRGADELARGLGRLDDSVGASVRQMHALSEQLRAWAAWIRALEAPTLRAAERIDTALRDLQAMTVGRDDPRYAALLAALEDASAAVRGDGVPALPPVTSAAPASAAAVLPVLLGVQQQLASSVEALAALPDGVAKLGDAIAKLRAGADRLAVGQHDAEGGTERLDASLHRLAGGGRQLDKGIRRLHDGASRLDRGLGSIDAGAGALSRRLAAGDRRAAPLSAGLRKPNGPLARYATVLHGYDRQLRAFDARSPGAISSGYLLLTALDGTVPGVRDEVAQAVNVDSGGQAARILVVPKTAPNMPATDRLSRRLRRALPALAHDSGSDVAIGEGAQALIDYRDATIGRLPWLVIGLTLIATAMLMLVLRALLLPLVAVALNLVTIAAAFGALELLIHAGLFEGPRSIDAVSAAGVFAIMFVLAIDYEVFLLTRMRESWVAHREHERAIAEGVRRTAGVITGAAVIMSAVFLAFAASGLASLSQFGAGLTVAVLLDATVVRLVLLPALMRVLGPRVWWLPRWLERWLPNVEHGAAPPAAPDPPAVTPAVPVAAPAAPDPPPSPPSPPCSPVDELDAVAHAEHRHLMDLLQELELAGTQRDGARVSGLAHELRDAAVPHFRYEQRALFPQLVDAIGPERVERLYAEQDGVLAALGAIEAVAGGRKLDTGAAEETRRLVREARAGVAACDGLARIVAQQPAEVAERVLAARARVLAEEPADAGSLSR